MRNNYKNTSMTLNNSENFINKEWRRMINAITKFKSMMQVVHNFNAADYK